MPKPSLFFKKAGHVAVALIVLSLSPASAEDLVTGPPEGTALTPVPCYANGGPFAGREQFDAAGEIGEGPGAFLFIHELNRNTAPVIRGFDKFNSAYGLFGFTSFNVRLVADRTAGEEELSRVNGALKLGNPIVLSLDGMEGPGNYALNRKCLLSLVLVKDGAVTKSVPFVDTGLKDLPKIRELIEETIGDLPQDAASLRKLAAANLPESDDALRELAITQAIALQRFLQADSVEFENSQPYAAGTRNNTMRGKQMRTPEGPEMKKGEAGPGQPQAPRKAEQGGEPKPEAAAREGRSPDDPQLSSLLRSFVRKTNDDETANQVFADIQKRSSESDALRAETVEMFKLMLSFPDRYGSEHAQNLARQFLEGTGK